MKKLYIFLAGLFPVMCSFFFVFSFVLTTRKIAKDDLDMIPTLSEKDLCLISRGIDKVSRGRIVLINHDGQENLLRVVGVGGDTVEIRNSEELYVNGKLYVPERFIDYNPEHKFGTYTVDEGHIFVLGDNRSDAYDSGDYGQVPLSEVEGVVRLTFLAKEPDWSLYPLWDDKGNRIDNNNGSVSFEDFGM